MKERDRRWNMARSFMERKGFNALLIYGEHEDAGPGQFTYDNWFTNFRPGTTVLFPKDGEPIMLVPMPMFVLDHMQAAREGDRPWISVKNVRIGRHSHNVVQTITEQGLAKAKIGVIGLEPYPPLHLEGVMSYPFWQSIRTNLTDVEFNPTTMDFSKLMMCQSEEEIAMLRHASLIGEAMAGAMADTARPGVSEAEVYTAGMAAAHSRGAVVPWIHMCTGSDPVRFGPPSWFYRPKAPRVLQKGDVIASEIFSVFGMRQIQQQASIAIGHVHNDIERAADVARACYDAGIKTLLPKAKFSEVVEAMLAPVEAAGGWVRGPQIHGLNPMVCVGRIPDKHIQIKGIEDYPEIHGIPTMLGDIKLEPGMSFAFEPSCGFGNHIVTIGGTVIVGENGVIELNPSAADLLRVTI